MNARVSFRRSLWVLWIQFLSFTAQDDEDGKGLKLEKKSAIFSFFTDQMCLIVMPVWLWMSFWKTCFSAEPVVEAALQQASPDMTFILALVGDKPV